jgi:hypothetical protein
VLVVVIGWGRWRRGGGSVEVELTVVLFRDSYELGARFSTTYTVSSAQMELSRGWSTRPAPPADEQDGISPSS